MRDKMLFINCVDFLFFNREVAKDAKFRGVLFTTESQRTQSEFYQFNGFIL
jgi:hypothetical protein